MGMEKGVVFMKNPISWYCKTAEFLPACHEQVENCGQFLGKVKEGPLRVGVDFCCM